jgi:hypothetical protein
MNTLNRIAIWGALTMLVSLSGCIVAGGGYGYDHGPYRYENGDRIDRDGRREAHWCDGHKDEQGCR